MMIAAAVLAASLSALSPADIEDAARRQVALEFERVGRRTPIRDEALSAAARHLAKDALRTNARAATGLLGVTEALSFNDAWDPSPKILIVKGSPVDEPLRLLRRRRDLPSDPASHVGVGVVMEGDTSALVILLADRRARMERFVRRYDGPVSPRELCGTLEPPLAAPEVLVTRPDGRVEKATFSRLSSSRFCAKVPFPDTGRYTVEVLGRGPKGPEVAALFFVDVGRARGRATIAGQEEPKDAATARAQLLERINALRQAHGASPLQLDDRVTAVAQAYSEKMAREQFFAHVSPEGDAVGQRLRAAGYAYRGAGENLGLAGGPLAAHFGIEHSPGHRKNLIDPAWSRVGIGIAEREVEGARQVYLTEIYVDPMTVSADPIADAYRLLNDRRAELGLPKLERNAVLEQLARNHARRALALEEPKAELPDSKLHDRVFKELAAAKSASIDFFVADDPALIQPSKATSDRDHKWVGIGAVKGDSRRFGRDKYWVVVIYAAAN